MVHKCKTKREPVSPRERSELTSEREFWSVWGWCWQGNCGLWRESVGRSRLSCGRRVSLGWDVMGVLKQSNQDRADDIGASTEPVLFCPDYMFLDGYIHSQRMGRCLTAWPVDAAIPWVRTLVYQIHFCKYYLWLPWLHVLRSFLGSLWFHQFYLYFIQLQSTEREAALGWTNLSRYWRGLQDTVNHLATPSGGNVWSWVLLWRRRWRGLGWTQHAQKGTRLIVAPTAARSPTAKEIGILNWNRRKYYLENCYWNDKAVHIFKEKCTEPYHGWVVLMGRKKIL